MAEAAPAEDALEGTPEQEAAAIKIQAAQRGKAARKEVESMRAAMAEAAPAEDALEGTSEQEAAAIKIQAAQR
eukprot:CAMPEP_0118923784 /NCGR_PEP_ID=MMETSP1169-20130426/2190_1 /TAXON_ID=36882 /ORGANISM="Pyramimonas obovata, Strain CCMP722" /LENGTH=72 /DNA_ID=CAMNT_0006864829 /DNA_START=1 /DNA_END=216 /DNA_ORIENTATION=+